MGTAADRCRATPSFKGPQVSDPSASRTNTTSSVWSRFWSPASYLIGAAPHDDQAQAKAKRRSNSAWLDKWLPKYIVRWTCAWVGSQWFLALASDLDSMMLMTAGVVFLARSSIQIGVLFGMLVRARMVLAQGQGDRRP